MNYVIAFFLISLAILVHELGHFIAAKATGIPIKVFSLGFGPPVFVFKRKNTEYWISIIPVGGFVLPEIQDHGEFLKLPVLKRMIFSLGGPVANFLLAIFCFGIMTVICSGFSLTNLFITPVSITFNIICDMILLIPSLFTQSENISGVIGAVSDGGNIISSPVQSAGFIVSYILNSLLFLAIFSINIGIFNLLPIPALDGGKFFLYLMETIYRPCLRLHMPLTLVSWVFILGLLLYTTVVDIGRCIIGVFI